MRAAPRSTLGWIALGALLAVAVGFAVHLLRSQDADGGPVSGHGVLDRGPAAPVTRPVIVTPPVERTEPAAAEEVAPATGGIAGRVVTADRRPVRDARVEACSAGVAATSGAAAGRSTGSFTVTDALGRFGLAGLPAGEDLVLRVDGPGFAVVDAGPYRVVADQTADAGEIIVASGLAIVGEVFDARGESVAAARIALFQGLLLADESDGPPKPERLVLSDEAGRYRIPDARPAQFTLRVSAPGYANAEVTGGPGPDPTEREIRVPIALRASLPVRGLVTAAPDHAPQPGALVVASPADAGLGGSETRTDAQGQFLLDGLAPGHYVVTASAPGRSEARLLVDTAAESGEIHLELPLQGSLAGTVLGDDGRPVTQFEVQPQYWSLPNSPGELRGKSRRVSDPDGAFRIDGLDAGFWNVLVWARGYAMTGSDRQRVRQGEAVGGLTVRLLRAGTLLGRVEDAVGSPVAGAEVWLNEDLQPAVDMPGLLDRPRFLRSTHSGSDGRFELGDITPDTYQVVVDHPGFVILRRDGVAVASGERRELEPLVVQRGATVEGIATAGNGQVLSGVEVHLISTTSLAQTALTDGNGHFRFQRVVAGDYRLTCYGRQPSLATYLLNQSRLPEPFPIAWGQAVNRNVVAFE